MTVVPINARSAERLAELNAEPTREYVTLQPAARNALTALKARVGDLDRIFAGAATPRAMADRIAELTAKIQSEAQTIRRYAR